MDLSSISHIDPDKLSDFKADLFITTLSHESRCTNVARLLEQEDFPRIAMLAPEISRDFSYRENKAYFQEQGYQMMELTADTPDMGEIMKQLSGREARIMIDCTSMSQFWYHEFFRWFGENQEDYDKVRLRLVHTLSTFEHCEVQHKVKGVKEFLTIEGRKAKEKKALILGLGHECNVSEAICKMENPDLLYLYYADPPVDKRFVEEVFVNNHEVIQATPIRNLIRYPIRNSQLIYQSLIDTILPIRNDYSITLIPQGPKVFSVASMLVQMSYPDTLISYPVMKRKHMVDRLPIGEPVILDVFLEGGE